ncbi:hypothetical protein HPP92_023221 [Vanilla planifolia]|uniref:Magnesium transporter n=1 Tax=Vanilla planifolia TaxID=51239 RepID=A0A835PW68_VANPL|nr:hypothetical protein HPP92_023221 [Vanilla planifolia]
MAWEEASPEISVMDGLKKKAVAARSWILLDSTGEEKLLDVDKYAIMQHTQINARDLRILDPFFSYPSTILGRERAIVLNLEHIKAIVTAEEVLLRDPFNDDVVPIVEELRRHLQPVDPDLHVTGKENFSGRQDPYTLDEDESPFEFRALEVALEGICSFLDARTTELETAAYPALDELTTKVSSRNMDKVRKLKGAMTRLTGRVQKIRDELEQLLDNEDDMADLYLSRKEFGALSPQSGSAATNWSPTSRTIGTKMLRESRASATSIHGNERDVEQLEMLLELRQYINDTEDFINIQLDKYRNRLIQLDLFLNSANGALSINSLISATFGMNLPFSWNENHGYIFTWVVILSCVVSAMFFVAVIWYARHKGLVGPWNS